MPEEERAEKSLAILAHFETLSFTGIQWLLSYYPLRERNEFDISACERSLRSRMPQLQLAWPRIDTGHVSMEAYPLTPEGLFAKNRYNILEPISGEPLDPESLDLVFVPMVIFDMRGYRVGYGKGYYDRYLLRCRPGITKIGFCYFEAISGIRDINEFDVPLNICITPSRIYEF